MPREESRILVRNWVSNYNSTEQQPVLTRVDPDVLADQETPPAPFPKSDEAMRTPPITANKQTEKDCDKNVWECEIAVCRDCAVDMEKEWRERAVNGWKH